MHPKAGMALSHTLPSCPFVQFQKALLLANWNLIAPGPEAGAPRKRLLDSDGAEVFSINEATGGKPPIQVAQARQRGTKRRKRIAVRALATSAPHSQSQAVSQQASSTVIFFWKASQEAGYLSHFYEAQFTCPKCNHSFRWMEQFLMWHKAKLAGDHASAQAVLAASSPQVAKALGRAVQCLPVSEWDQVRACIDFTGILAQV